MENAKPIVVFEFSLEAGCIVRTAFGPIAGVSEHSYRAALKPGKGQKEAPLSRAEGLYALALAFVRVRRHALAGTVLATDWPAYDASLPEDLVVAAYAISGLFELAPLVGTSINGALRLDQAAARAASPLFWKAPSRGSLDAVVGENESAEYFRQSRTIVEHWGAAGLATRFGVVPAANHFTAIAPLAEPGSPMTLRLKQLATR